jgi:PKD repeat protein
LTITLPNDATMAGAPVTISVTIRSESATDVTVDFGDGTIEDLDSLSAANTVVVVHTYRAAGRYSLTAIVKGRTRGKATASVPVFVS